MSHQHSIAARPGRPNLEAQAGTIHQEDEMTGIGETTHPRAVAGVVPRERSLEPAGGLTVPCSRSEPRNQSSSWNSLLAWYLSSAPIGLGLFLAAGLLHSIGVAAGIPSTVAMVALLLCAHLTLLASFVADLAVNQSDTGLWELVFWASMTPVVLVSFGVAYSSFRQERITDMVIALSAVGIFVSACVWLLEARIVV